MSQLSANEIGRIYDEYALTIYRYIYHRLGNSQQAEDLTGEVFVRLIRSGGLPEKTRPYLYRCAHNVIIDYLRRNSEWAQELSEQVPTEHSDPARFAELESERARLRHVIARLTPDQQEVLILKYVEGFSNREIGEVLERPEGAVKSLVHRALTNLRILLGVNDRPQVNLEFARLLER